MSLASCRVHHVHHTTVCALPDWDAQAQPQHCALILNVLLCVDRRIYDLIDDMEAKEHKTDFTIVEDRGGRGIHARGLTEHTITSEEQALNLLFRWGGLRGMGGVVGLGAMRG